MAVFMYDFIAFVPEHRCYIPSCDAQSSLEFDRDFLNFTTPWDDDKDSFSKCDMFQTTKSSGFNSTCNAIHFDTETSVSCDDWVYNDDLIHSTAVEDFEMVCGNQSRKSLTQTMYMLGMLIGSFLYGWLSDLIGRKTTLMLALTQLALGGSLPYFISSTVANFYTIVIFRFLSGMGHVGTFMMAFNLALECVGAKYRTMFGILIETPFAIGGLIVGIVSYAGVRDWKLLTLVLSAPNLLVMVMFLWLLPESPRWLITKNKTEKLRHVLTRAARTNNKTLPMDKILETKEKDDDSVSNVSVIKSATVLDLFWPPTILIRSSTMFLNWMVTTMCYYGLTSASATLTPDLYLNYSLAILVEIPAHFATILLLDRLGRKPVLGFSQVLAGVTCIAAGFMNSHNLRWLQVSSFIANKALPSNK